MSKELNQNFDALEKHTAKKKNKEMSEAQRKKKIKKIRKEIRKEAKKELRHKKKKAKLKEIRQKMYAKAQREMNEQSLKNTKQIVYKLSRHGIDIPIIADCISYPQKTVEIWLNEMKDDETRLYV
jgi:hypothetical protein